MGREWDGWESPASFQRWCAAWAAEALRVLKPGGYMLAFGGTRTWHRLVCGIEDAGFEVRDAVADLTGYDAPGLMWVYGSGFPKSLDVSKAIDKRGGNAHLAAEIGTAIKAAREARGWTTGRADRHFCGGSTNWTWYEGRKGVCRPPTPADFARIVTEWPELASLAEAVDEVEREVIGRSDEMLGRKSGIANGSADHYTVGGTRAEAYDITAPATDDAARWSGWGTALKPGWEPICVARKPLAGTVASNVVEWGTGALNIDGCRVDGAVPHTVQGQSGNQGTIYGADQRNLREFVPNDAGRWPPNVVLGPAAAAELDRQSGVLHSPGSNGSKTDKGLAGSPTFKIHEREQQPGYTDTGGASRFFPVFRYEAKAPASERPRAVDGTAHPTVKPVDLMRWLVRLVTPPGGLVLDPFAGSGTTGEACIVEGFRCVLAEKDPASAELIVARLRKPIQPVMFGLEGA